MDRSEKPMRVQVGKTKKTIQEKIDRWERMLKGDEGALWECMYDQGMCSKEDLNEYYRTKESLDG